MAGQASTLQLNGIIAESPSGVILSVIQPSVPTEHKVSRTGSKNLGSGALRASLVSQW